MTAAMDITIRKASASKLKDINLENLPFGRYFTDHMLEADYENGEWKNSALPLLYDLPVQPGNELSFAEDIC